MDVSEQLNPSIDPKQDFYEFAVGGWLAKNPMPPSESTWGTFLRVREDNWLRLKAILEGLVERKDLEPGSIEYKLATFYGSAIDPEAPETPGKQLVKEWEERINGAQNTTELIKVVAALHKNGWSVPWCHFVDVDDKNSEQYVLRLKQAGLSLPDRDYYFKEGEEMEKIRAELRVHIPRMARLMDWPDTEQLVTDVLLIEAALADASMTRTETHDLEATYNKFSSAELQKLTPNIAWDEFFQVLGVAAPSEVVVNQPKFFVALNDLLATQSLKVWQNYLRWHLLRAASAYLGEQFEAARFLFNGKVLSGTEEIQPRWKRVVIAMHLSMGEPLGRLFVAKHFPPEAKARMEILVGDLRDAFEKRITQTDWMELGTREKAVAKLRALRVKIGYPDKWRDHSALETDPQNYFKNILAAWEFEVDRNLKKLGSPIDKDEWLMEAQDVNAYNWYNLNEIVFPAGILQPPFFDMQAGDPENYGAIGSVIGHEMTHGFDDHGGQFDIQGNMLPWRTEKDIENFKARCEVLKQQADNYEVLPGLKLNGTITLGENTSDIGGIEIALDALERRMAADPKAGVAEGEFTALQRFFLSAALYNAANVREQRLRELVLTDSHSPAKFRVNGVVTNVDRFYDAFSVGPEDAMYTAPENRAKIW